MRWERRIEGAIVGTVTGASGHDDDQPQQRRDRARPVVGERGHERGRRHRARDEYQRHRLRFERARDAREPPEAHHHVPAAGSSGQCNGALDFDGVDDRVTMGQAPSLGLSQFTLEAWIKRTGTGQSTGSGSGGVTVIPLIAKGRGEADGDTRDCNYFFGIRSTDGVLAADFEDMATGANHPVVGATPVSSNVWHHVAVTYDGTTWRLYLDGAARRDAGGECDPALR